MQDTKIEWADDTVNGWWGCERVSPACTHCYAADVAARFHPGDKLWGLDSTRRLRVENAIGEMESIARRGEREGRLRRVFMMSMGDLFEDRPDLIEPRKRIWDAQHRLAGRLIPMNLTKRPDLMAAWAKEHGWPEGAWAGTTVEDQQRADERIPELLRVPAGVRFLSMEPLLSPIDLDKLWCHNCGTDEHVTFQPPSQPWCSECDSEVGGAGWLDSCASEKQAGINWIIVGGESGPKARPMHDEWAQSLRDQARAAGVPFLFKQWGEWLPEGQMGHLPDVGRHSGHVWLEQYDPINEDAEPEGYSAFCVGKHAAGRLLDGRTWDEVPG